MRVVINEELGVSSVQSVEISLLLGLHVEVQGSGMENCGVQERILDLVDAETVTEVDKLPE